MKTFIIISEKELVETITSVLRQALDEHDKKMNEPKNYKVLSKNQVAKKLGISHFYVKKLVESGKIKSTINGWIPEVMLNKYLEEIADKDQPTS